MPKYNAAGSWHRWVILGSLASTMAIGIVAAQAPQPPKAPAPAPPNIRIVGGAQVIINGQVFVGGQPGAEPARDNSNQRVKLPIDPRARRKVEEAKRFIETQDWQSAVKILQSLLDATEDNFLQESESDKGRRVSVRAEANRLLGSLPAEGKRFYEQQFGSVAKLALKQAKAQANPQQLAEVALKYVHTQAGAEAAAWLGSYHLDHGRYIVAALCFERLLNRDGIANDLSLATLYKAAIAFERSGDAANREKAWSLLQAKLKNSTDRLPVALRSWDEDKLRASLKTLATSRLMVSQNEWRLFMGSPDRAARSNSTTPFMEPMFPAIATSEPGQARNEVENASKKIASMGVPIIHGSHPLIVRDFVIYRTLEGLAAFNLKTGAKAWDSPSDVSFAASLRSQNNSDPEAMSNLNTYRESAANILIENTLLGTLSADNELVYSVEDMALPPNVQTYGVPWRGGWNRNPQIGNRQGDFSVCNHLIAYDIEGGRAVWSIGTKLPDQPFSDMFFLGPPLPLGDKLYVLAEVNAEIKLLCLQNVKSPKPQAPEEFDYTVELVWSQPLGVVDRKLSEDPVRRTQAATLSYSDGILVCPTNAGAVVGMDLLTRTLVWAYNYQNETVNTDNNEADRIPQFRVRGRMPRGIEGPTRGAQWSYSAPVIAQGKVLLAPPDGDALHAINLRDGTLAWSVNRVDTSKDPLPPDNYLGGVFEDSVILVGKQNVHALDLKTGKPLWNVDTGIPSGRGIANDDTYFLPTKSNEIVSVALKTGTITARHKARQKEQLGNLALVGEHLVSLNHHHLIVYPIQLVKERQVAEKLKANPRDPTALLDRGEIRWQAGDVNGAMSDFRTALSSNPSLDVKFKGEAKLTDALMGVLEKNFNQHENVVPELERMTIAVSKEGLSAEERSALQDRQARYYRLLAKGRESQGRIAEALASLQAFAQLEDKLITSPDDPLIRVLPKVWAVAQAEEMTKRLKPELRSQFDLAIEQQWQAIQKDKNPVAYKAFVEFYGTLNPIGNQAQLQFIETLIEKKNYSEATLWLLPLLDVPHPAMAGKAYDMLARLNIKLNEMENAAYYYRILARKFPNVVIRDGKTGKQLYLDLQTDKRFLPYLDDRQGLSNLQQFTIDKMQLTRTGGNNQNYFVASFLSKDEPPPHLRRYSLQVMTDFQNSFRCSYVVRDLVEKKELINKWNFAFPTTNFNGGSFQERLWPQLKYCGNVMVFAWSNRIVGYDPVRRKELWNFNVMGDTSTDGVYNQGTQTFPSQEMPGRFQMILANGSFEVMGTYGPGSAERLVMTLKNEGMICINPQTGERLWSRYGISPSMEMFGDEEYVILLPPKVGRRSEDQITAIRILDGAVVPVNKTIAADFRSALAMDGRHLLRKAVGENGSDQLTLVDPLNGEVVWSRTLPSDAILLKSSQQGDLTGFASREGDVEIINLRTGKTELRSKLSPLTGQFEQANFVMDDNECYLFFCKDSETRLPPILRWAGLDTAGMESYALAHQFQWLRSVPVNGPAACVGRETGKVNWQENFRLHYVVTQRFQELPFLLCSAVTRKLNEADRNRRNPNQVNLIMNRAMMASNQLQNELHCFSKQTGKLIAVGDKPDFDGYYGRVSSNIGFQELMIDQQTGRIELKAPAQTLSFSLESGAMTADKK